MNGAAAPFSAHQDVLDAPIPTDDAAARARLLDECKNRGRGAVQAKAWPDAAKLYRKALECCTSANDDNDKQTSAILNSNLSLVEGKMNGWDAALTAAQQAVTDDPTYTKAWWRLGQAKAALQDCDGAVEAIQRALQIEPTNKALLKELEKMKKAQAAAAASKNDAASAGTTTTSTSTAVPSTKSSKGTTTTTTSKTKSATTTSTADDGTFTKSDHVKGYKIVNGKKTSYFHNELSAEAAQLIGDIAPKKIDTAAAAGGGTSNSKNDTTDEKGSTSAWNKAGTWEEKDVTSWAKDALAKQIKEHANFILPDSSPAAGAVASVTKCTCVGHASVAAVRGKKRYIYEFSVTVHWKFVTADGTADEAAGTLQFPDVDGTCAVGEPYDASNFVVKSADDPSMRPVLEAFVHKQGLRDALHVAIDDWVRLFRETY